MQTKKRKMKAGEAFVGIKRRGSQLWKRRGCQNSFSLVVVIRGTQGKGEGGAECGCRLTFVDKT